MPEASVDEYGKSRLRKYKIWMPVEKILAPPAANRACVKQLDEGKFG